MRWLVMILALDACAAAPAGYKNGNPNCILHCVIDQVEAPGARAPITATQNGATSVTRSAPVGSP